MSIRSPAWLAVDNQAFILSRMPLPVKILLVTRGNRFLEKALRSSARTEVTVAPGLTDDARAFDLVVLDDVAPIVWPVIHTLTIHTGDPAWFESLGTVQNPPIVDWKSTHPLLRFVSLDNVQIAEALSVKVPPWGIPLVESPETPLLVAGELDKRRVVWVAFDVLNSTWPLRISFPIFIANAVEWALRAVKGELWQPGAGGMGLHTLVLDPRRNGRIFGAISAAGVFRSDDAGASWRAINNGLRSLYELPDPEAEVGHCVHRIAMHPARPDTLYMQKHWHVLRSDDAGESWREVSGNLPSDFGFPIAVHAHEPETIYVVPIESDSLHYPPEGKLRVYRSRSGGDEWQALTDGLPQQDCYVNVLRDAMAVDALDPCGVYFGTTGGQVYVSADAGDSWAPIARNLPSVVSVEVQTLP